MQAQFHDTLMLTCRASMILFYVIEAVAIYAVIKQHPHDSDAAVGWCHMLLSFHTTKVPIVDMV